MAGDTSTSIPTFTMTPELERVIARGRSIHPTFPEEVEWERDIWDCVLPKYTENIQLPDLDNKKDILRFLGLNDTMIDWALKKYDEDFSSDPEELAVKYINKNGDITIEGFTFPLLKRLASILMERGVPDILELDENYDDYVRGGLAEGLRPEFAIFCGLHPSEPDYQDEKYREHFYIQGYQEQADGIIRTWVASLSRLWNQKLKLEAANRQAGAQLSKEEVEAQPQSAISSSVTNDGNGAGEQPA